MSSNVDIRSNDDALLSTVQPMKNGLSWKLKKLFRKVDEPSMSTAPEDGSPQILLTPEEIELEHRLTYFTDILHTVAPYSQKELDELKEHSKPLVELYPLDLRDPISVLSADFYDGRRWEILYTQEHKYDALRKYLSSPKLETIIEDVETTILEEMQPDDGKSEYSQPEYQTPANDGTCPTSTETLAVSSDTLAPAVENEVPAFFALLPQIVIQNRLKDILFLDCIPNILCDQICLDTYDRLSWLIEDSPAGVPVRLVPQRNGKSDRLEMRIKEKWVRLKGSKKMRFLDDLARIQVAYASITCESLGPLTLMESTDSNTTSLFPTLNWNKTILTANIQPTFPTPRDYLLSLSPHDAFTTRLLDKAANKLTFTPGPYPLCLPPQIISYALVNRHTGTITKISNSINTRTVPWEVAALPPLKLSPRSHERYVFSLKRHYFGTLVRNKGLLAGEGAAAEGPKLYELASCAQEEREIWECIGGLLDGREEGEWRERMVEVVLGRKKGWEEEKRRWEEGIIN